MRNRGELRLPLLVGRGPRPAAPLSDRAGWEPALRHSAVALVAVLVSPTPGCVESGIQPLDSHLRARVIDACGPVALESAHTPTPDCEPDPPVGWQLTERWHWSSPGAPTGGTIHVGRIEDSDGDAAITANDNVSIWYVPYDSLGSGDVVLFSPSGEDQWSGGGAGAWRQHATLVRLSDPLTGALALAQSQRGGQSDVAIIRAGGVLDTVEVEAELEWGAQAVRLGDNGPLVTVWAGAITRFSDGVVLRRGPQSPTGSLAADLDRDGGVELIVAAVGGVYFVRDRTSARTVCPITTAGQTFQPLMAIGQLDDDDDGEVALLGGGAFAVCDGSGELLQSRDLGAQEGGMVAIAELDGDKGAEFVVGLDSNIGGRAPGTSVLALDGDATTLWEYPTLSPSRPPLSVADLDGDGTHEVLVHDHDRLLILNPSGGLLAEAAAPTSMSSVASPVVADVDGDDLAEVVVSGTNPTVAVYGADAEGWPAREASRPWPGLGRHPEDRSLDGSVPTTSFAWWLGEGANVWQGLPAGPAPRPDLGVEVLGACAHGQAEITLTVRAWNAGSGPLEEPAVVSVFLGDATVSVAELRVHPPLDPGEVVTTDVELDVSDIAAGVRARITPVGTVRECGESPNEDSWTP